jgi:hypothetical protein
MAEPSIYHKLNDKNAILTVFKDQVNVLRSGDTLPAIGTYNLGGCSCLLGLGTTSGSAIVVARISHLPMEFPGSSHPLDLGKTLSMPDHDEHHMGLVRRVVDTMMSNHELFQLPVVYGVFGKYKEEVLLVRLRERIERVFSHLNIKLRSSFYEIRYFDDMWRSSRPNTLVAVQHQAKAPELYVGDRLIYPASYSGSLASVFDELSLEQITEHNGGDDREGIHDNVDGDEGRRRRRL